MGTTRGYPNHLLPLPLFSPTMASSSLDVSSVNDHFAITFLVLPSSLTLPLIVLLSLVSPLLNHPISLHWSVSLSLSSHSRMANHDQATAGLSGDTGLDKWLRGSWNLRTQASQPRGCGKGELGMALLSCQAAIHGPLEAWRAVGLPRCRWSWSSGWCPETHRSNDEPGTYGFNCVFLSPRSKLGLKSGMYQLVSLRGSIWYIC